MSDDVLTASPVVENTQPPVPVQTDASENFLLNEFASIQHASLSIGKQVAALFLGAVAFTVAMSWNATIKAAIDIWTPYNSKDSATKRVSYNAIASVALTVLAVIIAAILTRIYGEGVRVGEATSYGLAGV